MGNVQGLYLPGRNALSQGPTRGQMPLYTVETWFWLHSASPSLGHSGDLGVTQISQINSLTTSISQIRMLLPWNKERIGYEVRGRRKKKLVLHGTSQSEEHAQI